MLIIKIKNNKLDIAFVKETPADLIAVNSYFSARFPKVIIEDNRTEIGNASGTSQKHKIVIEKCHAILVLFLQGHQCISKEIALITEKLLLKM